MTQPDRAAIDAMNKALDAVFGNKKRKTGRHNSLDEIDVGRRRYDDELGVMQKAGATQKQVERYLQEFARTDPISTRMIMARDRYRPQQSSVSPADYTRIRKEFLHRHTKSSNKHNTRGAMDVLGDLSDKYGSETVKATGYYARQKQMLSHPAKVKNVLDESLVHGRKFAGRPIYDKAFTELGSQSGVVYSGVAHNLKALEEFSRVGQKLAEGRVNIQNSRIRGGVADNVGPMLGRIAKDRRVQSPVNWKNITGALNKIPPRSSTPYRGQAQLTPIKLPKDSLKSIQPLASQFVAEKSRNRFLSQASNVGKQLSQSNYLKSLGRSSASSKSSIPSLNFIPSRSSSPSHKSMPKQSMLGTLKNKIVSNLGDIAIGGGIAGAGLGIATQVMPKVVSAWASGMAGFMGFNQGGMVPKYGLGTSTPRMTAARNIYDMVGGVSSVGVLGGLTPYQNKINQVPEIPSFIQYYLDTRMPTQDSLTSFNDLYTNLNKTFDPMSNKFDWISDQSSNNNEDLIHRNLVSKRVIADVLHFEHGMEFPKKLGNAAYEKLDKMNSYTDPRFGSDIPPYLNLNAIKLKMLDPHAKTNRFAEKLTYNNNGISLHNNSDMKSSISEMIDIASTTDKSPNFYVTDPKFDATAFKQFSTDRMDQFHYFPERLTERGGYNSLLGLFANHTVGVSDALFKNFNIKNTADFLNKMPGKALPPLKGYTIRDNKNPAFNDFLEEAQHGRLFKPFEDIRDVMYNAGRVRLFKSSTDLEPEVIKLNKNQSHEVDFFNQYIQTAGKKSNINALLGFPLHRGVSSVYDLGATGDMEPGMIIPPNKAHTYMSLSNDVSVEFGKDLLKMKMDKNMLGKVAPIGKTEAEFITMPGLGFEVQKVIAGPESNYEFDGRKIQEKRNILHVNPFFEEFNQGGIVPQFAGGGDPTGKQMKHLSSWVSNSWPHNSNAMAGIPDPVIDTLDALKSPLENNMMAYKGLSEINLLNKGLRVGRNVDFGKIGAWQSITPDLDDALGYASKNILAMDVNKGTLATKIPENLGLTPELVMPPISKFRVDSRERLDDEYNLWNLSQFARGGDTFNTPIANGVNSKVTQDAVKRLQLLRIRAQAGHRLSNLRDDAQLNMQLGNTSLFRSPNTAAGVINARVLRNLQSRFSGDNSLSKFATGGHLSTLKNPIRVSTGELALTDRGVKELGGLENVRRINAGDVDAMIKQGFAAGGDLGGHISEYYGPGHGTSDSILEDAARGPGSHDDVKFIIKKSSTDKLKDIMGGNFPKVGGVGKFAGGGKPFGGSALPRLWGGGNKFAGDTNAFNKSMMDYVTGPNVKINPNTHQMVHFAHNATKSVQKAFADNPTGDAEDIFAKVLSDGSAGGYLRQVPAKGSYNKAFEQVHALKEVLENVLGQSINIDLPDHLFDNITKSSDKTSTALAEFAKVINDSKMGIKRTSTGDRNADNDIRKAMGLPPIDHRWDDMDKFTYRGEVEYEPNRGARFGAANVAGVVEGGPGGIIGWDQLHAPGMGGSRVNPVTAWFNRNIAGSGERFMKELISPTEMQYTVAMRTQMPIGMTGGTSEAQMEKLQQNRREFNEAPDVIMNRIREEFGDLLGGVRLEDLVTITQSTADSTQKITYAVDQTSDKEGAHAIPPVPQERYVPTVVGVTDVRASALKSHMAGKIGTDEYDVKMQRALQPSEQARAPLIESVDGFDAEQIRGATVQASRFHEEVSKIGMTSTAFYKFGDIMSGVSWRFSSLAMSAMGVYFSVQGLLMTFQSGLGAITTPLSDIDALLKNIGMSTAFGQEANIYNASSALRDMSMNVDGLVSGWKNLTNLQGTVQTFFASIGAKIFGDSDYTDSLMVGISTTFKDLTSDTSLETFRDLIKAITDSLPAIVPAIKGITNMLQVLADNPVLIEWGAQLMMISLLVQPIASGLASIVTVVGGLSTIGNLFWSISKALWATSAASHAASAGFARLAMGIGAVVVSVGGIVLLYEAIANLVNYLNLFDFELPTLTGAFLGMMKPPGFAEGGEIGGKSTAAVDDKLIRAEEGEFVVRKDIAQKHKGKLHTFNKTGEWPGHGLKAYNAGGFVTSAAYSESLQNININASPLSNRPAVETTFNEMQIRGIGEKGNAISNKMSRDMDDTKNGDAWNVYIKNWPNTWGNGDSGGNELPFDLGYPYHMNINPTMFQPSFMGYTPNPNLTPNVNTDPNITVTPTWNRNTTNITPNLTPDVNPDVNTDPNVTADKNTTGIVPTSSALNYIGQILNQVFTQIVNSFQDAVGGITKGFFAMMDAAHAAGEAIGNFTGAVGEALGNISAKPNVDFFNGVGDNEGTPTANALGFRGGSGDWLAGLRKTDYEDLLYHHGGYTKYGDKTNYLADSTKRSGFIDRYRHGRILPQAPLPDGMGGLGPRMREIWPHKQLFRKDFPYDYGEVARALTTEDPYQVALAGASATTSNAIVGGVGKGLQYGALRYSGTLFGGGLARVGAGFSQMNIAGGNPLVFAAAHFLESGQAMDEFMDGRSIGDLKSGESNAVTGLLTGGFSTAGFGKGMEVWGAMSGLDEGQMREKMKANEWLFDIGVGPGKIFSKAAEGIGVGEEYDSFFDKLKGGNRAVSDLLESASFKVGDLDIGKGAGDIASAVNKGVYDIIEQALNIDVGTIFGAGTSVIGIGAGAVGTAKNAAQMAAENPWSMAQLGITAGVPILGPFLAALGMPQTTDWLTNTKGYGMQNVSVPGLVDESNFKPLGESLTSEDLTAAMGALSGGDKNEMIAEEIGGLSSAIKELAVSNQTPMNVPITLTFNVYGADQNEITQQINNTLQSEVPNILRQYTPKIAGH